MIKKILFSILAFSLAVAAVAQVKIACVGASITEGYLTDNKATDAYPAQLGRMLGNNYDVMNFGVGGCTMMRHANCPYWTKGRLGEALASMPDIVFIDLGGNDSKPYNAVFIEKDFVDDAVCMIEMFKSLPSHPRVIFMTPTVFTQQEKNEISDNVCQTQVCPAVYEAAKQTGIEVLDMYPCLLDHEELVADGIHPNTEGSKLLAEKMAWYLKKYPAKPSEGMTIDGMADNPFITDLYTADPSARVWDDGRLYVYASHDIAPPRGCDLMDQYHVFSTDDMIHWTDHGEILRASDVPWGRKEGGFMWAPDCAYRNGKYYFYFPHPSATRTDNSWKIGIAISDSPASGFKVKGYVKGMPSYIDPCVFVDDDGQAYIYNGGGGHCYGGRLKNNMVELKGKMVPMEGLVDFHEGTWVFKRDGKYYLMYPDNHVENGKGYNRMHYAMSDSPLGPWEHKGIILDATDCDTSHGSIVEYRGEWYMFYHNCSLSHMGNLRSICVDRLYFNEDGTIQKVRQRHHCYIPRK
jgi:arabinoxylan arabinofuranohydrolase